MLPAVFLFPVCSPYFLPRESTSMRIWNKKKKKGISSPGCSWCQLCSSSVWCLLRSQCCQQSWVIKSKSMSRKNPLSGFHHFLRLWFRPLKFQSFPGNVNLMLFAVYAIPTMDSRVHKAEDINLHRPKWKEAIYILTSAWKQCEFL